ncbi:MAG: AAA domain-containing protein [Holophagales bacterium]|nr:AAA domain-containing protein [Holophagales bacterium]MYC11566.1 AAA domain-containing protein [Holophagales bacterium]
MTRVLRIRHQALRPVPKGAGATDLNEIVATDRDRAALLLQGAALLAHVRGAGWRLEAWEELRVDADGVLRIPPALVRPARDDRLPQALLRQLVVLLFGSEGAPGRSAVRAMLRPLFETWRDELLPVSGNRMVADILARAPFLWAHKFEPARSSLFAVLESRAGEKVTVAGHSRWRRMLAARDGDERREIAAGGVAAQSYWRRVRDAASESPPPETADDRSAQARLLLEEGRFEAVLKLVKDQRRTDDVLTRLRAQLRLGRTAAARRTLSTLENRALSGRRALDQCELAIGIHAAAGRSDQIGRWSERVLDVAVGRHAAHGRVLCALAKWELGALDAMAGLLEPAVREPARWSDPQHWMELGARARLAAANGRFSQAEQLLATGLRRLRERLPVYERALLYNELATVRLAVNDFDGAERAACIAVGLFRRCDGPAGRAAAHGKLAEIRIRTGRFTGVAETIENLRREGLMAGSAPGVVEARLLEARLFLSQGRWESALECCETALESLSGRRSGWRQLRSLRLLSARALVHLGRVDEAAEELSEVLERPLAAWTPAEVDDMVPLLLLAGLRDEARAIAVGTAQERLWEAVDEGRMPGPADWRRIEAQDPFHAALTVHDLVCLGVETVPVGLVAAAARIFSFVGAEALVQRVDGARIGPWRALRLFLATPDPDADAYRILMAAAGHPEARLAVHGSPGGFGALDAQGEVLLQGPGGSDRFAVDAAAGRLVLSAKGIDEPARALAAAVATRLPASSRRRRGASELAEPRRAVTSGMVGKSKALLEVQARVEKFAAHDLPVLILGESGTGKELLARQLHRSSARASRPWLAVNCAALPDGLLLSDLFGHLRGAFTGAHSDRVGVFESADGGTVFLDEIGELPWAAQGMLLRLLQEGEMRRVGESRTRRLDFRLVSATHKDLAAMVKAGEFRQDLYYRLRVAYVEAPPLRERDEDVMLLAEHFLETSAALGQDLKFSDKALGRIRNYSWPGNIRELKNAVDGAVALAEGPEISVEMLGLPEEPVEEAAPQQSGYHWKMEQYRRRLIGKALEESGGNQAKAARALGISRQALSYLVRKLNYEPLTDD